MTLIVGATGQLGTAMRGLLPGATLLTRSDLDLVDTTAIRSALDERSPTAIINCGAFADVDGAEADEPTATSVNCTAVGEMAVYAADHDIPLVSFSTDYVFDGTATRPYIETSRRNPVGAYGRSKACGERVALTRFPDALIIRTSWLISGMGTDFVSRIIRLVTEKSIKVVDDQRGSPTIVDDLAVATLDALDVGSTGLLHVTNAGDATWFDLAVAAAESRGLDQTLITACTSEELPTRAKRPAYSVLASERRSDLGLLPLPHWRESLPLVMQRIAARS